MESPLSSGWARLWAGPEGVAACLEGGSQANGGSVSVYGQDQLLSQCVPRLRHLLGLQVNAGAHVPVNFGHDAQNVLFPAICQTVSAPISTPLALTHLSPITAVWLQCAVNH